MTIAEWFQVTGIVCVGIGAVLGTVIWGVKLLQSIRAQTRTLRRISLRMKKAEAANTVAHDGFAQKHHEHAEKIEEHQQIIAEHTHAIARLLGK